MRHCRMLNIQYNDEWPLWNVPTRVVKQMYIARGRSVRYGRYRCLDYRPRCKQSTKTTSLPSLHSLHMNESNESDESGKFQIVPFESGLFIKRSPFREKFRGICLRLSADCGAALSGFLGITFETE